MKHSVAVFLCAALMAGCGGGAGGTQSASPPPVTNALPVDLRTGAIVNNNSSGVAFSQNPDNGCVLNGNVSIINAQFN